VSKVKVTGAFTTISLSAQILKNACPQCIDFDFFTFEEFRIQNLAMHLAYFPQIWQGGCA
jgi:hypothetical protein